MVVRESAGSLTRRIVEAVARGLRLMGTPSGPVRVLIVDDISETRELLGKLLSYSPMVSVVGLAAHGWDALAQLRRTQPDVALVDIYMPVVAGDQLVAVMSERFPATKAIILTVASSDYCGLDTVEAAIENGAVAYVHKPPSGDRLGQVIHDAGRASRKWTWFCPNPSRPVYAYTGQLGPEAELIRLEGSFGENGPRSIAGLWITEGLAASWPEGNIRLGQLTELQLDGILGLDLSLTDVSDSEMGTLPQLGNLKTLLLLDTKVGSEGAEFLLRYPRLEVLSVRACAVSEHTLSILSRLPPLRLLDLSDVSLKDSATTRVAGLPLAGC